jgi:hypothetical protein
MDSREIEGLRATVFAQAVVDALDHVGQHNEAIDPYVDGWDGANWQEALAELRREGTPAEVIEAMRAHYQGALRLITRGLTGAEVPG